MKPLLLLIAMISSAATLPQTHDGKTCAEILKMGSDKWFELYTKRNGESTHAMSSAYHIYGDCLAKRNDRQEAKLPKADRDYAQAQYKQVRAITVGLFLVMARGGGTMWNIVGASDWAEEQYAREKLIRYARSRGGTAKERSQTDRLLKGARINFARIKRIIQNEEPYYNAGTTKALILKELELDRLKFERWAAQLPRDRTKSNLVLIRRVSDATHPKSFSEGG